MLPPIVFEIAGFVGVAVYLGSYAALQAGFIRGSGYLYAALNLIAASLVLVSLFATWNLWSAIIQISWVVISIVGITRIWVLRRALRFDEEEEHLISTKFATLDRVDARRLLNVGQWQNGQVGDYLTLQGKPVTELYFLADGSVAVDVADQEIATVGPDHFIGEMACLEQGPASATVRVKSPTRHFVVRSEDLCRLLKKYPDIAPHIHYAFYGNTQAKLINTNIAYSDMLRASNG